MRALAWVDPRGNGKLSADDRRRRLLPHRNSVRRIEFRSTGRTTVAQSGSFAAGILQKVGRKVILRGNASPFAPLIDQTGRANVRAGLTQSPTYARPVALMAHQTALRGFIYQTALIGVAKDAALHYAMSLRDYFRGP